MDNGIYLNDIRTTIERGFREACDGMAGKGVLDSAIRSCCRPAGSADGSRSHGGYVAERSIVMTLSSGEKVTIPSGAELCIRDMDVRFLNPACGIMEEIALSAIQHIHYSSHGMGHPWD